MLGALHHHPTPPWRLHGMLGRGKELRQERKAAAAETEDGVGDASITFSVHQMVTEGKVKHWMGWDGSVRVEGAGVSHADNKWWRVVTKARGVNMQRRR